MPEQARINRAHPSMVPLALELSGEGRHAGRGNPARYWANYGGVKSRMDAAKLTMSSALSLVPIVKAF